ncbi:TMEM165/GDT1 family protein [Thalassolituus sp. LLYu03]|uniref:TMEM165/GDT1 family protein n=1 Tax=Thalassolituus sp. LLYu03 TaxID=3421656 RepID=UPI003D2A310F
MSISLSELPFVSDTVAHSGFITSALTVAVAEIGDKTQLLSLLLAAKFRNKAAIVLGILLATLLNHAASAWLGVWLGQSMDQWLHGDTARWLLAGGFVAMALWVLVPDKDDDSADTHQAWGAFLATTVLFFLAEIGDKTQVATVLLGAEFDSVLWVTLGTTVGMMLANVPVVLYGDRLMQRMPLNMARYITSAVFVALALWVVLS